MSITTRRADRLRIASRDAVLGWPPYVSVVRVTNVFRCRWDVEVRWLPKHGHPDRCWIHTSARTPAGALRQALRAGRAVAPGRRFHASDPDRFDPYPGGSS